ncbi:hypothetical protein FKM82_019458 [Ascaphus truei]
MAGHFDTREGELIQAPLRALPVRRSCVDLVVSRGFLRRGSHSVPGRGCGRISLGFQVRGTRGARAG